MTLTMQANFFEIYLNKMGCKKGLQLEEIQTCLLEIGMARQHKR